MIDLQNPDKRLLFDTFVRDIEKQQYTEIKFSLSQEKLRRAALAFLNFLTLPQDFKDSLYRPHPVDPRDSGIGYVRKEKKAGLSDGKEYVHYLPVAEEYFKEALHSGEDKLTEFFNAARSIHKEAITLMEEVVTLLSIEFPELHKRFFPDEYANPRTPLRFLKYDTQGKGEFLARGHYDIAGCTLALAESAPGLRIGKDTSSLKPVLRKEGGAIFMPALNFPKLTDERFIPAWHDVVQHSEETLSEETARWAIVMFLAPKDLPAPSFEDVHKPL